MKKRAGCGRGCDGKIRKIRDKRDTCVARSKRQERQTMAAVALNRPLYLALYAAFLSKAPEMNAPVVGRMNTFSALTVDISRSAGHVERAHGHDGARAYACSPR